MATDVVENSDGNNNFNQHLLVLIFAIKFFSQKPLFRFTYIYIYIYIYIYEGTVRHVSNEVINKTFLKSYTYIINEAFRTCCSFSSKN